MGRTYEALKRAEAERKSRLAKENRREKIATEVPLEGAGAEAPETQSGQHAESKRPALDPLIEPALDPVDHPGENLPNLPALPEGRWARIGEHLKRMAGGQSNGHANGNGYANGNGNGAYYGAGNDFHGRKHFSFDVPPTTVEEFQQLRKNILAARGPRALQLMLLVSSRHGEGVTTTTALLGSTMAQGGRCLVIDANFRTPGLTNVFGGETRTGLCEALADGGDGSDHIHPTDLPNLYFMPTGIGPMRVPYMFEGRSFDDLLGALRKDFDTILIDGAPMEMYADSAYLAPRADGVVVVIQAEATPVSAPAISLRELERVNAPVIGAILNRTQNYIPETLTRLANPQDVIEVAVIPEQGARS